MTTVWSLYSFSLSKRYFGAVSTVEGVSVNIFGWAGTVGWSNAHANGSAAAGSNGAIVPRVA